MSGAGAGGLGVAANLHVPLLEEIERRAFQYFWEQACEATGLVMTKRELFRVSPRLGSDLPRFASGMHGVTSQLRRSSSA
jgi:hypothetical protein